jgi:hypothetical protein
MNIKERINKMRRQYDELLLKIEGLIADKHHINMMMRHDFELYNHFMVDYPAWYKEVHDRIDEGFKLLKDCENDSVNVKTPTSGASSRMVHCASCGTAHISGSMCPRCYGGKK